MKTVSAVLHIGEEGESVINSAGVLLMLPPLFLSPVRLSINSEGREGRRGQRGRDTWMTEEAEYTENGLWEK